MKILPTTDQLFKLLPDVLNYKDPALPIEALPWEHYLVVLKPNPTYGRTSWTASYQCWGKAYTKPVYPEAKGRTAQEAMYILYRLLVDDGHIPPNEQIDPVQVEREAVLAYWAENIDAENSMKRPKRLMDYVDLIVVSSLPLTNGYGTLPARTLWKVRYQSRGLTLQAKPCSLCGGSMSISRVDPTKVLIPDISYNQLRLQWNQDRKRVNSRYGGKHTVEPKRPAPEPWF